MKNKNKWNGIIVILSIITIIMYLMLAIKLFAVNGEDVIGKIPNIFKADAFKNFSIIFLSILLEALPFVMIGSFVSALIHLFVSEKTIIKIIPNNKIVALICAGMMGIIFPVCECAIVPIMRRLVKKGVPIYIAVTFMLAVPIVNPIVLLSTYYAFSSKISIVIIRGVVGFLVAVIVGFIISVLCKDKNVFKTKFVHVNGSLNKNNTNKLHIKKIKVHNHGPQCSCGHDHGDGNNKIISVLEHTSLELREVGKFLIIGAFISAILQAFVQREIILSVGQGPVTSILTMMILAFVLSLCSEADAFIASTFSAQFTTGSIAAFLILGPMIDIKNTIMLSGSFKSKFIIKLITVIFAVCFIAANIINLIGI